MRAGLASGKPKGEVIMRRTFAVLAAASLLLAGLVAPAAAGSNSRPFKGSVSGSVAFVPFTEGCDNYDGFNLSSVSTARGQVSHMGRTSMSAVHCTPDFGVEDVLGGQMTLEAANHDKVFIAYEGTAPFPGPGVEVVVATLVFEILDGTGRFEGATGGGDMIGHIVNEGMDDFEWPATWHWKGKIGY